MSCSDTNKGKSPQEGLDVFNDKSLTANIGNLTAAWSNFMTVLGDSGAMDHVISVLKGITSGINYLSDTIKGNPELGKKLVDIAVGITVLAGALAIAMFSLAGARAAGLIGGGAAAARSGCSRRRGRQAVANAGKGGLLGYLGSRWRGTQSGAAVLLGKRTWAALGNMGLGSSAVATVATKLDRSKYPGGRYRRQEQPHQEFPRPGRHVGSLA